MKSKKIHPVPRKNILLKRALTAEKKLANIKLRKKRKSLQRLAGKQKGQAFSIIMEVLNEMSPDE